MKAGTHETEKSCFYYIDFLALVLLNNKREEKIIIIRCFLQSLCHKLDTRRIEGHGGAGEAGG